MFEGMFPMLAKGEAYMKCLKNLLIKNSELTLLHAGIPELGIEHFEPLILPSVQVSRGSGSLTLAGGFKNLIVKGPSNTTVSRAK